MRIIVAAAMTLALSATSSAAQTVHPNITRPGLQPPSVGEMAPQGHRLESPPGLGAPHFTAAELEQATARKVELLHALQMTDAAAAWLRPSMWATPRYSSPRASLSTATQGGLSINLSPTPSMPYGSIRQARERNQIVVGAPASVRDWLLFDCIVDGAASYRYRISLAEFQTVTPSADHHVVVLFPPSLNTGHSLLLIPSGGGSEWSFGGCEITPIEPP